ncbi:MAG: DNA-binding HxlR family transcriptional regulator [Roseivirga sp.]|jgi:DNA-binding HxlR family transcriptional regulator
MTDEEFDVLDELYFVQSFDFLKEESNLNSEILTLTLKALIEKGWVKCFADRPALVPIHEKSLGKEWETYFYLATKDGLLAHNGR